MIFKFTIHIDMTSLYFKAGDKISWGESVYTQTIGYEFMLNNTSFNASHK